MSKLLGIKELCELVQNIKIRLNGKVDKVAGKGLSTNDYTTAEKNKLAGIQAGAEVNVQSDWNQTNTSADDFIKNKPTIPTRLSQLTNDSDFVEDPDYVHTDNNFTTAEKDKLAGIASGAEVNVQSDWNQATTTADDYIKNKPSIYTKTESDNRYVKKTGDTMSGTLTLTGNSNVRTRAKYRVNTTPSSSQYQPGFFVADVDGTDIGYMRGNYNTDGSLGLQFEVQRTISGTRHAFNFYMWIDASGNARFLSNNPTAIRNGISAVYKGGDTMTGGLTLQYGVPQYDIKATGVNLKAANNGSSSSQRPGYVIHDHNGLNVGQFITLTSSSGNVQTEMLAYNYNTSGTSVGTNYIQCNVTKNGAQTYAVANQANFRSAIGAAAASSSSKRYKHDIAEIQDEELDPHKLYDLPVKQFVFNDDHDLQYADMKGKTIPGFIAEDVAEIYPSAVIHDEDGRVESWDERRIIPAMLKLIQEQHEEIERLKQLIASA